MIRRTAEKEFDGARKLTHRPVAVLRAEFLTHPIPL